MKRYNLTALLSKRHRSASETAIMNHMIIHGCVHARELSNGTIKYHHSQSAKLAVI